MLSLNKIFFSFRGQTETTVGEEKKYNPRLTKTLEEFVEIMDNLNLPYPKKIGELCKHCNCAGSLLITPIASLSRNHLVITVKSDYKVYEASGITAKARLKCFSGTRP